MAKAFFCKCNHNLGGCFGYFLFFLRFRGRGKGGRVRGEKGGYFLFGNRERGGFLRRGGGVVSTGAGRVSWEGGGGLNIFFRGRNVHQVM